MALRYIKSKPSEVLPFISQDHFNKTNCSLHAIDEYPDWFTDKPPRYDFVIYCSILSLYLFLAIAIVCNDYCVPSVERICYKFGLSYDVAGATLMALTTSSPELFISIYATFLTEGDMGIGTIVGSSVFNVLAIPAFCCLFTGVNFSIDWWPVTRDLLWYCLAVLALTLCLWDGRVLWWEASLLSSMYVFNVINLLLDRKCQRKLRDYQKPCKIKCFIPLGEVQDFNEMQDPDIAEPFNFAHWPKEESCWEKLLWLIFYPLECIFFLTIPNVQRSFFYDCNFLCLFMCTIWTSILTYLCSWTITVIGYNFFLPDSVMGLIVLAAGTSVPEAISSVIVTKKGYGSMAVCNAVGSNTVDIFVCLGVPWLIKSFYFPTIPLQYAVSIASQGLPYTSGCLLISALLLFFSFMVTRFQMNRAQGLMCLFVYIAFITVAVFIEMIYFDTPLPHCSHMND